MRRHCQNCGKELDRYATNRKKFCKDKCRVQFHRKASAQGLYGEAIQAIGRFSKVGESERKAAIENLRLLKKEIDFQLRALGDAEANGYFEMLSEIRQKRENLG